MQRLERLFAINEAIRRASPRPVSAARMADDFGVSRRTIERDIAALKRSGVPLYAERGRDGGQVSLDQLGNIVVTLTPAEVIALLVATAAGGSEMPWSDAGMTATGRLLDALPPATRNEVEQLRGRVRAKSCTAARSARRVRRTAETAVQRGVVVNITYEDLNGSTTDRAVDALGFYEGTEGWFLVGWCHLRQDGRIFRLDRIRRAHLTKASNEVRDLDEILGWIPNEVSPP